MRFDVPALDKELGIETYLTDADGIGGRLRELVEDFVVEEIPLGFSSIEEFTSASLSRLPSKYEKYAICTLEKRGIDTIRAASIIAQRLHFKEEEVGYCGLKDAKAISRQLVSIPFRRPLQREYVFPEGIRLQLLGFRYRPLSLGELSGNQFSITTRMIEHGSEELVARLESVTNEFRKIGGFPGYFGYQRFGSRRPISHLVGRWLHQDNVVRAVDTLLNFQTEADETREASKQLALEEDYGNAPNGFPSFEKRLVEHLSRYPDDFEGALKKLPQRLRRLFYDAYQSFLYNKAASLRFRERKTLKEIRQGDLVASFDERGYVSKVSKVTTKNLKKINAELRKKKLTPVIAIPSQLNGRSSHPISPEVVSVIESEGLSRSKQSTMHVREGSTGIVRPIITQAESFGWIIGEDEVNLGFRKAVFYFRLRRSFYATVLLREFLKPMDPLVAGF